MLQFTQNSPSIWINHLAGSICKSSNILPHRWFSLAHILPCSLIWILVRPPASRSTLYARRLNSKLQCSATRAAKVHQICSAWRVNCSGTIHISGRFSPLSKHCFSCFNIKWVFPEPVLPKIYCIHIFPPPHQHRFYFLQYKKLYHTTACHSSHFFMLFSHNHVIETDIVSAKILAKYFYKIRNICIFRYHL